MPAGGPGDTPTVLVVDFGAQYAQLIARRVREARVFSEIVPHSISAQVVAERRPAALIFSGGPKSVHVDGAPMIDPAVYELGVPILGICYGAQLMAVQLGGAVERGGRGEYGRTDLQVTEPGALFDGLNSHQSVWMSHFDAIVTPPAGAITTAHTADTPAAAFEDRSRHFYGVQFHPEVGHTPHGQQMLERFLHQACGIPAQWTMENVIDTAIDAVRAQIGTGRAICGLSGGVDSAVAAALGAQGDRAPAHLCLRRHRTHAQG